MQDWDVTGRFEVSVWKSEYSFKQDHKYQRATLLWSRFSKTRKKQYEKVPIGKDEDGLIDKLKKYAKKWMNTEHY